MLKKQGQDQRIVRNVCANMRAEGFFVTETTQHHCQTVVAGKQTAEQLIKTRLAVYKNK